VTTDHKHGDVVRAKAIRKRVFGCMLLGLGCITAILARVVGFELDAFYVVISIAGASLFLYGTFQQYGAG
jgi:hypothetical protein